MDADGISRKYPAGQTFCFVTHNDTVVQQPLRLENFTSTITDHALGFFEARAAEPLTPWFFLYAPRDLFPPFLAGGGSPAFPHDSVVYLPPECA